MPEEQPADQSEKGTITQVEETALVKGKVIFHPAGPTPSWALWMFRTEFILNKMLLFYLTGTDTIPMSNIKEYVLKITVVDFGVWLFANSLGVKKTDLGLPDK